MKYSALLAGMAFVALTACSTIEVGHGPAPEPSGTEVYSYWHHNIAFSLYEVSSPVNLSDCRNDWNSLVIEKDLVTALAGSVDTAIILVDVWDPWRVVLNCAD